MNGKKIFLIACSYIALFSLVSPDRAISQDQPGVVLISHGSIHENWNERILDLEKMFKPANAQPSTMHKFNCRGEVAFLRFDDTNTLSHAINTLKGEGITNILLVHLSPFSCTVRHEEIKFLAGKGSDNATKSWLFKKAASLSQAPAYPGLQLAVAPAMDDHPLIIDILKEHARQLSRNPSTESVILLGYGPIEELENITWLRLLERIGKRIGTLGFREVVGASLRNHSADLIRAQAITELQNTAKRLRKNGRVIVVPYVLFLEDSFHRELQSCLRGIVDPLADISNKGILDHPDNTELWIGSSIENGMKQPEVMPVNRTWSAMDRAKKEPIGTNQYGLVDN